MSAFKIFLLLLFIVPMGGCTGISSNNLKSVGYVVDYADNAASEKWGAYLFNHLSRRTEKAGLLLHKEANKNFKSVIINVDSTLDYDYCIEHTNNKIDLKAKDEKTILWLIYQFMKLLGDCDDRFVANDLPPAIINCNTCYRNFDFKYREPFFRPNLDEDYSGIIGSNMVDRDWGLWGHNLAKVLKKDDYDSIYAKKDGWVDTEQYCFSSDEIFNQIKTYILNNFGNGGNYAQRFMIMPADNTTVCTCDKCKQNGNTEDNATPAVSFLINRLAKEYPLHTFFTSIYLTTKTPPEYKLPENTGVIISTIDLPKGVELSPKQKDVKSFLADIEEWKSRTANIYIWDYAANFDDYFTPLPVLEGLKKQLQFFKLYGINGVFLNASGYDYAPFDDVKTYVATALMTDTNAPVDSLCNKFLMQFYPVAGELLSGYYVQMERNAKHSNKPYNIYSGFREAMNTYFDKDNFISFYDNLGGLVKKAGEEEKPEIKRLYTALTYTRLQIAHTQGYSEYGFGELEGKTLKLKSEIKVLLDRLSTYYHYTSMLNYKEAGGSLHFYLENWKKMCGEFPLKNLLFENDIRSLSKLDAEYQDIGMLNDGVLGFEGDYHQGWLINSGDLHVEFDAKDTKNATKITMRFLINQRHRVYAPQKIEIFKNGEKYKEILSNENEFQKKSGIYTVTGNIDFSDATTISVKIYKLKRPNINTTLACDEIQLSN